MAKNKKISHTQIQTRSPVNTDHIRSAPASGLPAAVWPEQQSARRLADQSARRSVLLVGSVVGAYSGHGVAEAINHTEEEEFWREHPEKQEWGSHAPYGSITVPAYKTGYEGASQIRRPAHVITRSRMIFARDYEKERREFLAIPWDRAQPAVRCRLGSPLAA